MSRTKNGAASIAALAAELNADQQEALEAFMQSLVNNQNTDALDDLASDVKSSRRGKKTAVKPTRRTRKAAAEDDEDEDGDADDDLEDLDEDDDKPVRKTRGAKKAPSKAAPVKRGAKKAVEVDEDDEDEDDDGEEVTLEEATRDAVVEFMSEVNVEPEAGGVRELKPIVESWGGDFAALVADGEDRREKAELAGTFIAANKAAAKALKAFSDADLEELAEELGVEVARNKTATIKAILVEINSGGEDEDDADEDDDGEDEDGDED